jgi:putative phosphoribosyl transferase
MIFTDRRDAGRRLAKRLVALDLPSPVVLGVPRGGVIVAFEVARGLGAPLDIVIARKIGAPDNPELAVGAVAQDGTVVADDALLGRLRVSERYLSEEADRQRIEIERRLGRYRQGTAPAKLAGCTAVIVDDGIATGATVLAALRGLRSQNPARVVLAVPVAPPDTLARLAGEADEVICLASPEPFYAVGQFYRHFEQTSDEEVVELLERHRLLAE